MIKMFNNKIGSSYWFIYSIAFLFILTIIYIIFNQVLVNYIYPTSQFITPNNMAGVDRWLGFWKLMPFLLVFIVALFMFNRATQPG